MKHGLILLSFLCILILGSYFVAQNGFPVELKVPFAPTAVKAEGKRHVFYELHVTNFSRSDLELSAVEVLDDGENSLAVYREKELTSRLKRPGAPRTLTDKLVIGAGMRAIVFLGLEFEEKVPAFLSHRVSFKTGTNETEVEDESVRIRQRDPLVIGAPLRGSGWIAANGPSNESQHRRAMIPVNGRFRIAQRFAIDWMQFGPDGKVAKGDLSKNENWYGYGAELLSVSNATVVDTKDGIPENIPLSSERAVKINLASIAGNYVLLDLGEGNFAFYAHLKPGSLRVKVGDEVQKGQVIGLLGNSGNSDAPHLHFHVADKNSPLGAEGLPFVFEGFVLEDKIKSLDEVFAGKGWKKPATSEKRTFELPLDNAVVGFVDGEEISGAGVGADRSGTRQKECAALWKKPAAHEFIRELEKATVSTLKIWGDYDLSDGAFVLHAGDLEKGRSCFGVWHRGKSLSFVELPDKPKLSAPLYGFFRVNDDTKKDADPAILGQVNRQPASITKWLQGLKIRSAVIMPVEFPQFPFKIPAIVKVQLAIHEAFHMEVQFKRWLTGTGYWPAWDHQPDRKGIQACYTGTESVKAALDKERETLALLIEALLDNKRGDVCRLGKQFFDQRNARYTMLKDVNVALHDKSAGTCSEAENIMELEEGVADYASWTALYNLNLTTRERLMTRYRAEQKDVFYLTGAMQMHAISLLDPANTSNIIKRIVVSKTMQEGALTEVLEQELKSYCKSNSH